VVGGVTAAAAANDDDDDEPVSQAFIVAECGESTQWTRKNAQSFMLCHFFATVCSRIMLRN